MSLPAIDEKFAQNQLVHDLQGPGRGSFKAYHANALDAPKVLERSSVSLVVTSPPYPGVNQPTEDYVTFPNPKEFEECHIFLDDIWAVCYLLLADEGRMAVNIYDIPRGPEGMLPNVARVIAGCIRLGFVLREDYIWHKGAAYSPPVGSFPLPKGVLSGNTYEHILVFQKPLQYKARQIKPSDYPDDVKKESLLGEVERGWLNDPVWKIKADRVARKLGHPFPFPEELPMRLIKLYTMAGDTVFDPFGGAGTTGVVAHRHGRHGVVTELSRKFIDEMVEKRTAQGSLL